RSAGGVVCRASLAGSGWRPEHLAVGLAPQSLGSSEEHVGHGALAGGPLDRHARPSPGRVREGHPPRGGHRGRDSGGCFQPLAWSRAMSETKKAIKKRPRSESGEALLEIALVLPILLVLSMGMLDFGRAFHAKNIVDAAAREACRVAVVTAPDVALAQQRASDVMAAAGL